MSVRAYIVLFGVAIAAALVLTVVGRRPRAPIAERVEAPAGPSVSVRIAVRAHGVLPPRTRVPLGARVTLHARNADAVARTLALSGYDDRVSRTTIAGQDSVTLTFVADRPGDDFAWLVDAEPAGVFAVAGSHLVEGHR